MLADANAATEESELKCQNLTSKQVRTLRVQRRNAEFASLVLSETGYDCGAEHLQANAEVQLEAALLQLSTLQEQKEQMQRLHSSKMEAISTLATRLFEQISELDDSIGVSLYQLLLSSGAREMEGGAAHTRAPAAPAVDVRSPRLSQFFQGVHSGVKGRVQTRTPLELSNYSSQSLGLLSQLKDASASSPRGERMIVGASCPPPAHSETSTWPTQEPTRGMLVYLNLQMRDIAERPQFETELLEEVALAANVRADELKVLR